MAGNRAIEPYSMELFPPSIRAKVSDWLAGLSPSSSPSSNAEALQLPFQRWFKFKEAFSPRLVIDIIRDLGRVPTGLLDPFGGSGTTALVGQFLGLNPTVVELNPFLADLIETKLTTYDLGSLRADYLSVLEVVDDIELDPHRILAEVPTTFVEPGRDGRWVYPLSVVKRILAYRIAFEGLNNESNARLLKILLGSILVSVSNVVVNGKGRKYRSGWRSTQKAPADVDRMFRDIFGLAYRDIARFEHKPQSGFRILRGDCLQRISEVEPTDLAIFSPPYPNSFDYTDIYNLELWLLGYFKSPEDNKRLRAQTIRSHVQILRDFSDFPTESPALHHALESLEDIAGSLWNKHIPSMIGAYFADMRALLDSLYSKMPARGDIFMTVGNSSYGGFTVDVAKIFSELAPTSGFRVKSINAIRSMRASSQQGGTPRLAESLIHLTK